MNKISSFSKILFLSSLLILALSAVLVGCGEKTPAVEEIVNSTIAAMSKVDTYKYKLDMKTDIYKYNVTKNETGGENPTMKSVMEVGETLDIAKKEMHTTLNYSGSMQGQLTSKLPPIEFSMRPLLSLEFLASGNESYMKLAVPLKGEHWAKAGLNVWEYLDQSAQQIELLKTAGVDFSGTEKVNGIDCYILKTTPDSAELARWFSGQLALNSFGKSPSEKGRTILFLN